MATIRPDLFVVDGSNIATEGRSTPSLQQLNEAIAAFSEERPGVKMTVVVDATFGHRIEKSEAKQFDAAVAKNDIVTPPAGAVGRGDAFVLSVANKANAGVLSNDSFQEFHGEYGWLFDEGRLVGGKPVPHVGWVFVVRSPVRGPRSRQAMREAADEQGGSPEATKERANRRIKKKAAARRGRGSGDQATDATDRQNDEAAAVRTELSEAELREETSSRWVPSDDAVNDLLPFLEFVEHHPIGTRVPATVDSYSSHGAYARADDVLVYLPLRLMGDPAPRSARDAVTVGDDVEVVVAGFVPDRRSIDAALPAMAHTVDEAIADDEPDTGPEPPAKKRAARRRRSGEEQAPPDAPATVEESAAEEKTATDEEPPAKKKAAAKKAAAKKKPAAKKKAAAKKKPPAKKKAAAKKGAAEKPTSSRRKAPSKKRAAAPGPGGDSPASPSERSS